MSQTEKNEEKPKKKAKKEPAKTRKEPYTESLRCMLTRAEAEKYGAEAGAAEDRAEKLREELDAEKDKYKTQIKEAVAEFRQKFSIFKSKSIVREVACEREYNWETKRVREIRLDTKDVLNDRPMTEDEIHEQATLFGEPEAEKKDLDDEFN